ncbi:hypothetical protein SARC_13386, partial [Sphaeroforma arctica JP610]
MRSTFQSTRVVRSIQTSPPQTHVHTFAHPLPLPHPHTTARIHTHAYTPIKSIGVAGRGVLSHPITRGVANRVNKPLIEKTVKVVDTEVEADFHIVKKLAKYLWPKGKVGLKVRVIAALGALVFAKVINVMTPFYFKQAIDELNIDVSGATVNVVFTTAGALIISYGLARLGASFFGELRSALFTAVSQNAIRKVAGETFSHLHRLDLNYHLTRKTGALSKAIDRGSRGISFILGAILFNIVPTALELGMVTSILTYNYGVSFAG